MFQANFQNWYGASVDEQRSTLLDKSNVKTATLFSLKSVELFHIRCVQVNCRGEQKKETFQFTISTETASVEVLVFIFAGLLQGSLEVISALQNQL